MKKEKKSKIILLLTSVLVSIAAIYYFGSLAITLVKENTWKTYTNTKYSFQFKYPSDAQVLVDSGNANLVDANNQADTVILKLNSSSVYLIISPHHSFDPKVIQYSNLNDYVTRTYNIKGKEIINSMGDRYKILLFNEYSVGNKPAIKLEIQPEPNQGIDTNSTSKSVYIEVDHGNIMEIDITDRQGTNDSKFDQILSTFKFTN